MTYYAMSWRYGPGVTTDDWRRPGRVQRAVTYYAFTSRAARDEYVSRAPPGYREAVSASDAELRRSLARDAAEGTIGLRVLDGDDHLAFERERREGVSP